MKEQTTELPPATVGTPGASLAFPKQAGETSDRWSWVERSVWTERMLNRLVTSQEQTRWYSLWDKVWKTGNLDRAMQRVIVNQGSAGVDEQTVGEISRNWAYIRDQLQQELQTGSYRPLPARRVWIDKPGSTEQRPLGIPAVRDRIVQAALCQVLEPIFEREFSEQSYGFRPRRGCLGALQQVENLLHAGYTWVIDADLKSYFDTIPHEQLMSLLTLRIADGKVLGLIGQYLQAGIMESGQGWQPTVQGTPQGAVISPLLV